jgi:hypothetical protein
MDDQFSRENWTKLSVDQRVRHCRELAQTLRLTAEASHVDREGYLVLAEKWDALASEMATAATSRPATEHRSSPTSQNDSGMSS